MKTKISYSLLAAAMACGFAHGQTTAYTVPVGYVSVITPANSDTTITACLNRPSELQTTAVSSTGSVLRVKAPGVAANAFGFAPPTQPKTYYVRVLSGALVGEYQTIVSNLASNNNGTPADTTDDFVDLILEAPLATTGTPSILVAPHWTLNSLFPAGAGVGASTDPDSPAAFVMRQNQVDVDVDRAPNKLYFYFDGGVDSGWYENGNLDAGIQNDLVIYPDEFYLVRNLGAAAVTAIVSGEIPKAALKTNLIQGLVANDNYVSVPTPVDMTLVESGLLQSGAYTATTNPDSPIDFVLVYNDSATGFDKAATKAYFYYADPGNVDSGWYENGNLDAGIQDNVKVLKGGNGFVVRKALAGSLVSIPWSIPLPYSIP